MQDLRLLIVAGGGGAIDAGHRISSLKVGTIRGGVEGKEASDIGVGVLVGELHKEDTSPECGRCDKKIGHATQFPRYVVE